MAKRIIVIGDVMLDKYDYCGNADNPESSAPCWTVENTEYKPGGAGNVAANLASLGANFELISVVGNDFNADVLKDQLFRFKVPCSFIMDEDRQTIVKERIMSSIDGRYHCRINRERKKYIEENHVREILDRVGQGELVLVSDYRKGVISSGLMTALKNKNIPLVVDPKPEHLSFYDNVFLVKPNKREVTAMTQINDPALAAESLMNRLHANVLLTQGSDGISYLGLNGSRYRFPAGKRKVVDPTGAGDTVVATFCALYAEGRNLEDCVKYSNIAGGIAVQYPGCHQITKVELDLKN